MNEPFYEWLLFVIFCSVGLYINRRRFRSIEHQVFGRFMPEYIISIIFSLVIGIFLWTLAHVVVWAFR